jgi:Protein of unknown function (DUF2510)
VSHDPAVNLVLFAFGLVIAFVAYRESEKFKKANGVTPWSWPSWLWAVVGFVSLILCAILITIAKKNTKPVASSWGASPFDMSGPIPSGPMFATAAGMNGMTPAPAPSPSAPQSPAAWHPDPSGRYASRYWDGSRWTEHVSDGDSTSVDPI